MKIYLKAWIADPNFYIRAMKILAYCDVFSATEITVFIINLLDKMARINIIHILNKEYKLLGLEEVFRRLP